MAPNNHTVNLRAHVHLKIPAVFILCMDFQGCLYCPGLDYWTGLLDWTTGLDYWTDLLLLLKIILLASLDCSVVYCLKSQPYTMQM